MFCGIIRHQGKVRFVNLRRGLLGFWAGKLAGQLRRGDSIAVDGICLTVTRKNGGMIWVDLSPETIRRTHLRWMRLGWSVNLELPMRLRDRIHGHPVLGHIDAPAVVTSLYPKGKTKSHDGEIILTIQVPARLAKFMAEKGSAAVNGVSLTIARSHGRISGFALIPETLRRTNLRYLKAGSRVNLEVDMMARYALSKGKR